MAKVEVYVTLHGYLRGPFQLEIDVPDDVVKEAFQHGSEAVIVMRPPPAVRGAEEHDALVGKAVLRPERMKG